MDRQKWYEEARRLDSELSLRLEEIERMRDTILRLEEILKNKEIEWNR